MSQSRILSALRVEKSEKSEKSFLEESSYVSSTCEESSAKSRNSRIPLMQIDAMNFKPLETMQYGEFPQLHKNEIDEIKQIQNDNHDALSVQQESIEKRATSSSILSKIKNHVRIHGFHKEKKNILAVHKVDDVTLILSKGRGHFRGFYKLQAFIGNREVKDHSFYMERNKKHFQKFLNLMQGSTEELIKFLKRNYRLGGGNDCEYRIAELLESRLLKLAVLVNNKDGVANPEIVKQLLDDGVNPNIECSTGSLLSLFLGLGSQWTLADYKVTKLLLEYGANPDYVGSKQNTLNALDAFLTIYSTSSFSDKTQEEIDIRDNTLELLLEYKATTKAITPEVLLDILKNIKKSRAHSLMEEYYNTVQSAENDTPTNTYRRSFK